MINDNNILIYKHKITLINFFFFLFFFYIYSLFRREAGFAHSHAYMYN